MRKRSRPKRDPLTEAQIDADFLEMANDPEYQREAVILEAEGAIASWEAMQLADRELERDSIRKPKRPR